MKRTSLIAMTVATSAALVISACSSSKKGGTPNSSGGNPSSTGPSSSSSDLGPPIINGGYTQKGGTVNILVQDDFEHLDPGKNYVTNSGDIGRLIYRTLTFIKDTPGQTPTIEPDLATDLGTPNADKTVWTYHIRKGLKFEDGSPLTAKDIKYGIERTFDTEEFKDGATYMVDTLKNPGNYQGPYKSKGKDLPSVQTPDDYTLVFHFTGPQPDTDWMMSLFYTAPVPQAKDTKSQYDFHPVASGPYKFQSYTRGRQLTLVRNPNWSDDTLRPALPDKFVVTMGIAPATVSSRLVANQGPDQSAVSIDNSSDLESADVAKLRQSGVKDRFVNGAGPCVFYDFFNTETIKDPDVRHAMAMAINRQAVITAMKGPLFGSTPDNYFSTSVRGYAPAPLGLKPTGDQAAAKALLQGKSGYPKTIRYAVSAGRPVQKQVAVQIQSDLKPLGFTVNIVSIPTDSFYSTLRAKKAVADMGMAGWCWDWPTLGSIVPPVLGMSAGTWSPSNFSRWVDPTLSPQITKLASSTEDPATVDKQFIDISNKILTTQWPLVPLQASLNPTLVGSKIHNAGVSTIFSLPDLNTIGVEP